MAFVEIDCEEFANVFLGKGFSRSKRGNEMVFYKKISSHIAIVVYSSCSVSNQLRGYGTDAIRVTVEVVSDWDGKTPKIHPIFTSKTVKRTSALPKIIERVLERYEDAMEFAKKNLSTQPCQECNCAMYSSGRCFCPTCSNYYRLEKPKTQKPVEKPVERQIEKPVEKQPVRITPRKSENVKLKITDNQKRMIFDLAKEKSFILPPGISNFTFNEGHELIEYLEQLE